KDKGRKYLVVGEGLHLTDDARVFCLDVTASERERDGVKLWSYRTGSHVESSPCVAGGKVFIGAGDDGLYCFALDGDGQGNAKVLWHLPGPRSEGVAEGATVYPDCETSPVYYKPEGADKGVVCFGLGIGGHAVVCVDEDGAEQWRVEAPYPVFGSPSIADGKMYVGLGHGDFVNTAEQVQSNLRVKLKEQGKSEQEIEAEASKIYPVGEVWCIDLATHAVDWKVPVGRVVLGSVAVDGDFIYFGSRDGQLYRVTTDGKQVRKWNAHAPIITSPSVAKDHVYIVTTAGDLYGLDKKTMEMTWNVSLNSEVFSSPVVARGHVYVGTTANGLMCVGQPSGQQKTAGWPGSLGGPGDSGWIDGSLLANRGGYAWGYVGEASGDGQTPAPPTIKAPAAALGNALFVGLSRDGKHGLAKLACGDDLGDGAAVKQHWFVECANPISLSAAASEAAVFFVDGAMGDSNRALRCVDPAGGNVLWQHPVASDAGGQIVLGGDNLLVADTAEGLTCLDISSPAAKTVRWQAKVGSCVGMALPIDGVVMTVVANPAQWIVLDGVDGSVLLRRPLPSAPTTGPVYASGRTWIGQGDGLIGCSLQAGEADVKVSCGSVAGSLATGGDRLACKTADRAIVVIDTTTGKEVVRIDDALGDLPPMLTDDALLYVAEGAIRYYDLKLNEGSQWAIIRSSFPGNLTSPMIMVDSHVFFATDKKGLVCMKPRKR
ncbi:MAG: PQQ-binding-like beta-propeller repeat protein, partial [Planctomycetes bacterium]|nr:PQQ-binding-like beta-propeller repeat protein [Planctomycetota bacterium]